MPPWWSAFLALIAVLPMTARAAELQGRRYYLALRYAESNPVSDAHDAVGLSLGMNLTRHLGVELAADSYELRTDLDGASFIASLSSIGDVGVGTLIPQARLRYPLLRDRLVPYLIAGMGLAITQFNDRKIDPSHTVDLQGNVSPMGALGGGVEYHVADNIALGLEAKYLIGADQTIEVDGVDHDTSLDAGIIAFSMRFFYPQLDPDHAPGSGASDATNLYFGVRAGLARPVHEHVFGEVTADVENASIGGVFDQFYGLVLGANLGRRVSVEIPFQGYEMKLEHPTFGTLGEYALYAIVPELRLRHQLLQDRLQPYLMGGVGVSYGEFNDGTKSRADLDIDANDIGIGATLGVGVEYFVATNIALGAEARYLFARGHQLRIGAGPEMGGDLDSLLLNIGFRVFVFELGRSG